MSIIDNDSTTSTRTTPTLNVNDDGGVRKAHNTYGNTLRRVGSAVKQFLSFGQGTIEAKDADGNKSFFIGYDPALSTRPVIRVAKDGFDAQTGLDSNMIFNSEQNVLKVVQTGTFVIPGHTMTMASAGVTNTYVGGSSISISHNLGYTPAIIAFTTNASTTSYSLLPWASANAAGTGGGLYILNIDIGISSTEITGNLSTTGYGGYNFTGFPVSSRTIKYYLLQESAT